MLIKRVFCLILTVAMLLSLGAGCSKTQENNNDITEPDPIGEPIETPKDDPDPEPYPNPEPEPEPEPFIQYNDVGKAVVNNTDPDDKRPRMKYEFDPNVISSIYKQAFGEEVEAEVYGFCDAVLAGEDSFPCTGIDNWVHITELMHYCLPVSVFVSIDTDFEGFNEAKLVDGRYPLTYTMPKEDFLKEAERFKTRIGELIDAADIREGDSDLEKAMKLYTSESLRIEYDYYAADDEALFDLSVYRVLMGDTGICQEIAGAYSYLLLQAGVDSGICGTLSKDSSYAHEWTLINLGGSWYHADVTWQLDEPYSLKYFAVTDDVRDGDGLDVSILNIGEVNELWHSDLPISDETYAPLWNARWYMLDHDDRKVEYYDYGEFCYTDEGCYNGQTETFSF
jgi:hypothetical protein